MNILWEMLATRLGWKGDPSNMDGYLIHWQYMGTFDNVAQFRRRAGILGTDDNGDGIPRENEWVHLDGGSVLIQLDESGAR
jgi:hypothetical protein